MSKTEPGNLYAASELQEDKWYVEVPNPEALDERITLFPVPLKYLGRGKAKGVYRFAKMHGGLVALPDHPAVRYMEPVQKS